VLSPAGLLAAGVYSDVVMDDARLTVAVARDAAAHGAVIRTWTEPESARRLAGGGIEVTVRDRLDATQRTLAARVVVNATGPWADATRRWLAACVTPGAPAPPPLLRPSRGVHLFYPALTAGHGLLLTARADRRVFFVVPFAEWSLVGTTEIEVPSPPPPHAFQPTMDEVRYLRAELARVLPETADAPPLAVVAGVRPLLASLDRVGQASREHRVVDEGGILTIAGGKYTTFRVMARDTLARAARWLDRRAAIHDADDPLPPPLAGPATPERIADHAVDHELARRVEDVLRRRTALWLAPDRGRIPARMIAERMGQRLGWSGERLREEIGQWDAARYEDDALLERARAAG
jgi:glycerol-3-phosphate dehydrogenase